MVCKSGMLPSGAVLCAVRMQCFHVVPADFSSPRQTTAYFQKMAREVDLESFSQPQDFDQADLEGRIARPQREPLVPVFQPMRRKMHLPTAYSNMDHAR